MMKPRLQLPLALLAALPLALVACGGPSAPKTRSTAAPGEVQHLNGASFDQALSQDKPVLVDFWAPWCGPCRTQGPILEQAASRIGERALVGKVNVDEEAALAKRYEVRAIPTLIVFKGGKELRRFTGVQQAETLAQAIGD